MNSFKAKNKKIKKANLISIRVIEAKFMIIFHYLLLLFLLLWLVFCLIYAKYDSGKLIL
jgi:hypothetical protein